VVRRAQIGQQDTDLAEADLRVIGGRMGQRGVLRWVVRAASVVSGFCSMFICG
jgi:hypothetical protein